MPARTLIIGCGYVGLPLALRLQAGGDEVSGWVHSQATAGVLAPHNFHRVIVGSVGDEDLWTSLDARFDVVIHCASSGRGGEDAYREVFLRGAVLMNQCQPQARRIIVSSTSVYGHADGSVVTEESPAEPASATSRILREAERIALASDAVVVRSAGIYGPGRAVLFEKFRRGEAVIDGDGSRWINQVHRNDLLAALAHLVDAGVPGEIYNAADDTPVAQRDYYAWCAEFLRRPMPPSGLADPNRKRGLTSKRVSNAKLRATGWAPKYASFREGIKADYSPR